MKTLTQFLLLVLVMLPALCLGETAAPAAAYPILEKAREWLDAAGMGTVFLVLSFIVESGLRLIKSEKPRSIMLYVAGLLKVLADVLGKLAGLLDRLIPQRIVTVDQK